MTREEAKETLFGQCKFIYTYSYSSDRNAYDVPQYVLSDSKTLKLINQIFDEHEAQLKAKDEEMEGLKESLELTTAMCELGLKTQDTYSMIIQKMKFQSKARSIVAMLFWEWKKEKTNAKKHFTEDEYSSGCQEGEIDKAEELFKKAYAMLKDNA